MISIDYHYKALVESPECGVKRAVAFHDSRFLNWQQASRVAIRHIFSQTCVRCGENHTNNDYCLVELERGEPGRNGEYFWRNVFPEYKKSNQPELPV